MKVLCYSVRLESLTQISDKAFRATAFDGSTDIIPASQVYGQDWEVCKSQAYWISAWILSKKNIQYSSKKKAYFDKETHHKINTIVEHHVPDRVLPINNIITELKK